MPASVRPASAREGVAANVRATAAINTEDTSAPSRMRTVGIEKITKANSDPWESRNPSCVDPGVDQRNARLAAMFERILLATIRMEIPMIAGQNLRIDSVSIERPTDTKKKPRSSPRKGLISDWITAR